MVVPLHTLFALEAMLMLGVTIGFTAMLMLFELTTVEVAQATVEVKLQVTTSPFASVVVVKLGLLLPAFIPFTLH
jgi:hypothetical protein